MHFRVVDEKKTRLLELESKLSPAKRKIWKDMKEGLKQMELIVQGKMKGKSAKDLFKEP